MSSNVLSDDYDPAPKRFGTNIRDSPGTLQTVEEDPASEALEFNPHRMSETADEAMIENFLEGNPREFGSTPEPV